MAVSGWHQRNTIKPKRRTLVALLVYGAIGVGVCGAIGVSFFVIAGRQAMVRQTEVPAVSGKVIETARIVEFPVGVNLAEKTITENPDVDSFYLDHITRGDSPRKARSDWFDRMLGKLALMNWYQNLASLTSRLLIIESGERKEQVADHFAKILGWKNDEKAEFLSLIESTAPELIEGKFFPGTYHVEKSAKPTEVAALVVDRFRTEVLARYTEDVEAKVPLADALIIASLLEREAYDFEDMRYISGVIWNRLFAGMKLQIDATLQYAKGSTSKKTWWPRPVPSDKYIASAYNTYKNVGLPPAPIANSSLEAILAALNPTETECMYYFHDAKAGFHCTETYEEHVALLKQYYGRGK